MPSAVAGGARRVAPDRRRLRSTALAHAIGDTRAAARARQLRAPHRRRRRAGRGPAGALPAAAHPRHEPRAAAHRRRGRLARAVALAARRRTTIRCTVRGRAPVRASAPRRRRRISSSPTRTPPRSPRSAGGSTACRWRSSSPPRASAHLSPAQLAERLGDALDVLGAGQPRGARPPADAARDARLELRPARRRRARAVPPRSSVFAGDFDLAAARGGRRATRRSTCSARLVDKSLVLADRHGEEVRYRLLETFRQYGGEHLADRGARRARRAPPRTTSRWPSARRRPPSSARTTAGSACSPPSTRTCARRSRPACATTRRRRCGWSRRCTGSGSTAGTSSRGCAGTTQALDARPERDALRARALTAAGSLEFRRGRHAGGLRVLPGAARHRARARRPTELAGRSAQRRVRLHDDGLRPGAAALRRGRRRRTTRCSARPPATSRRSTHWFRARPREQRGAPSRRRGSPRRAAERPRAGLPGAADRAAGRPRLRRAARRARGDARDVPRLRPAAGGGATSGSPRRSSRASSATTRARGSSATQARRALPPRSAIAAARRSRPAPRRAWRAPPAISHRARELLTESQELRRATGDTRLIGIGVGLEALLDAVAGEYERPAPPLHRARGAVHPRRATPRRSVGRC